MRAASSDQSSGATIASTMIAASPIDATTPTGVRSA